MERSVGVWGGAGRGEALVSDLRRPVPVFFLNQCPVPVAHPLEIPSSNRLCHCPLRQYGTFLLHSTNLIKQAEINEIVNSVN
jgi:hypothetical protein